MLVALKKFAKQGFNRRIPFVTSEIAKLQKYVAEKDAGGWIDIQRAVAVDQHLAISCIVFARHRVVDALGDPENIACQFFSV